MVAVGLRRLAIGSSRSTHWMAVARLDDEIEGVEALRRRVSSWLLLVTALVVLIIGVGGATRLTGSGLSITEWGPIVGAVPPLSPADWTAAFEKYKRIPQYELLNKGMTLDEFRTIYWWEWGHRQIGRLIGLVYALPLLVLLAMRAVPAGYVGPLLGVGILIGMQAAVGWFMVQSGFAPNQIAVSPYRLTLHLSLAFAVLGLLVWLALALRRPLECGAMDAPADVRRGWRWSTATAALFTALLYFQIVAGGFVAGTRAGLTYNTWPLMDGHLIPAGLGMLSPWYLNLTENITTVQFNHRMLAYAVVALALAQAIALVLPRRSMADARLGLPASRPLQSLPARHMHADPRISALLLAVGVMAQAGLGIATLLNVGDGRIPILLGIAHQVCAAALLILAVWHLSRMMERSTGRR